MSTKFGLLVTVIVSCALVSAQGKPGIVHTDVKSGYAIVLPSGFKKESAADPIGNVQFTGPTDNGFAASVAIIGFPCESETPESIGKAAVAQVKNDPSYKVISAGTFKSSTISGYTWMETFATVGRCFSIQCIQCTIKSDLWPSLSCTILTVQYGLSPAAWNP